MPLAAPFPRYFRAVSSVSIRSFEHDKMPVAILQIGRRFRFKRGKCCIDTPSNASVSRFSC
jgi:hypothetical protein